MRRHCCALSISVAVALFLTVGCIPQDDSGTKAKATVNSWLNAHYRGKAHADVCRSARETRIYWCEIKVRNRIERIGRVELGELARNGRQADVCVFVWSDVGQVTPLYLAHIASDYPCGKYPKDSGV